MSEEEIKDMLLKQCLELTTNNDLRPPISAYNGVDIDDVVRACKQLQDKKTYLDLVKENQELKKQLEYLRSGEYYNQLRFENEMLQQVVDTNGVPSEVYDYIDCTHRNTELLEQQQEFIEYLENEKNKLAREISNLYEDSLGHTRLVNEDIFNEVDTILQKYKSIIGGKE